MVEEGKKTDANLWVKSGLGVGAISIVGYLLGFEYEKGYADYFAIPIQLIKFNLVSIFVSILGLVSVLVFIFWITNLGYMIFSDFPGQRLSVIYRAIIRLTPGVLLCFAALFIFGFSWDYLKWLIPLLSFFLFLEFVWPLITQCGKGTYLQKLEADDVAEERTRSKTLVSFVEQKMGGRPVMWFVVAIFMLFVFAYWIGTAEAQKQKSFWVIREPKSLVVLRIYGDRFVCAPFDSKAGTVEKTLYILDTPQQNGLWLDWQQVGPLKPVDKKVSEACNGK